MNEREYRSHGLNGIPMKELVGAARYISGAGGNAGPLVPDAVAFAVRDRLKVAKLWVYEQEESDVETWIIRRKHLKFVVRLLDHEAIHVRP